MTEGTGGGTVERMCFLPNAGRNGQLLDECIEKKRMMGDKLYNTEKAHIISKTVRYGSFTRTRYQR